MSRHGYKMINFNPIMLNVRYQNVCNNSKD